MGDFPEPDEARAKQEKAAWLATNQQFLLLRRTGVGLNVTTHPPPKNSLPYISIFRLSNVISAHENQTGPYAFSLVAKLVWGMEYRFRHADGHSVPGAVPGPDVFFLSVFHPTLLSCSLKKLRHSGE